MLSTIMLIISFVCFILAAANNVGQPVRFEWLGAAFWVLSVLLVHGV